MFDFSQLFDHPILDAHAVRILVIIAFALIGRLIVVSAAGSFIRHISSENPRGKRLRTLSNLFSNAVTTLITGIAFVMALREVGFDITPLIASAGVVGIAIGFGAQALVKDILSGFFLLLDEQFDEGDEVEINGKRGIVEKINLRTIEVREKSGTLHIIPAGTISLVSNFSKK